MRKYIMVVVVAACLALCAAVWPQGEEVEETPKPTQTTAVNTPEVPVVAPEEKAEVLPQTEKENTEPPQPELPRKPSLSQRLLPRQHLLSLKYSRHRNQTPP